MPEPVTFQGFGGKALPFLKALGFHQDRHWFAENKALYESEIRQPLGDLVEAASARFEQAGLPFRGSRKTSLFRIHRDVRFSKNKDPYNTHVSGLMSRTGTKKDNGFIYFHIANESSFLAAGFHQLGSEELHAFRRRIIGHGDDWRAVIAALAARADTLDTDGNLKRMPRGMDDAPEDLRPFMLYRSFVFSRGLDDALVTSPKLVDAIVEIGRAAMPLAEFGWRALDPLREGPTA
ncbi:MULTISPECIES: TIGR02453 family protein [unclassified Roseitalea]|uniref:TIGR02453 family protein n=1 Tax=unclassified Roseitalea TaxID=2639107 RepID=UPI00273F1584|nr:MULTISPECIES: TIGR02453 family protein [unclassified Roseitalea]